jgi:hypothetical protein
MQQRRRQYSLMKRVAFNSAMLLGAWLVIESMCFLTLIFTAGLPASLAARRREIQRREPFNPAGGQFNVPTVLHPYIGAVLEPKNDGGKLTYYGRYRITEFGFVDETQPIHKRSADKVIVGILGGSVAKQLSLVAADRLAEDLSNDPKYAGRTFRFVRLAGDGYKQPQQLMTICYLLSIGAEFDVVINLDGLNESALPKIDNVSKGVYTAFPRDWGSMVATTNSPEFIRRAGYVSYLREHQSRLAAKFGRFPLDYSPAAQLIWSWRNADIDRLIFNQLHDMSQFSHKEITYCGLGPHEKFDSDREMYDRCIEIWKHSSLVLNGICRTNGIEYFHFLQPNQYLADTKPIGPEEAKVAIREGCPIGVAVRECFPIMRQEGKALKAAGVDFTDLTLVFADHPEPIYRDDCCHVKETGDEIMA